MASFAKMRTWAAAGAAILGLMTVAAQAGLEVVLFDRDIAYAEKGKAHVETVLKKRLGARGDDMVDVSDLSALRGVYDRFGREFPGWAQLELTTKTPAEIMAVARRFARMSEPLTDPLLDGYIGPQNPKLLAIIKGSCNPQTIQVGRMANPLIGIVPAKYASNALIARLGNPKTTVIRGEEA